MFDNSYQSFHFETLIFFLNGKNMKVSVGMSVDEWGIFTI